jgi:hypothetical protein
MTAICAIEPWGYVSCRREPDIADRGGWRRIWGDRQPAERQRVGRKRPFVGSGFEICAPVVLYRECQLFDLGLNSSTMITLRYRLCIVIFY